MRETMVLVALLSVLAFLILPLAAAPIDLLGHEPMTALAAPDLSREVSVEPAMVASDLPAVLATDPWNLRNQAMDGTYHVSRAIACDDYGLEDHAKVPADRDRQTEIGSVLTTSQDPVRGRSSGPN